MHPESEYGDLGSEELLMAAPRPEAWAIARCFIEPDDRIEAMAEAVESALIAAESAARADERERAAKVCEERAARYFGQGRGIALKLAAAIREGFDAHS